MKTVSAIITTYNSERHIARTIDSMLNQSGLGAAFQMEVIVVDDCSTDRTLDIVKRYKPVMILSTNTNSGGPNRGRNIGLKAATGDYLCIADHDDEWASDRIMSLLPFLEKAPIVSSGYILADMETGKKTIRTNTSNSLYICFDRNVTFMERLTKAHKGQHTYLGSLMYRRELKHIMFEEVFGVVDFDWLLRLFFQNSSIEVCKPLISRYIIGSNLSLNETYRQKDFYYSLMFIEQYRESYPKAYIRAYKRIHGTRARYYYLTGDMKKARFFFRRSDWTIKTLAYYITSYMGSGYVKKRHHIFG